MRGPCAARPQGPEQGGPIGVTSTVPFSTAAIRNATSSIFGTVFFKGHVSSAYDSFI